MEEGEMWVEYELVAPRPRQVATGALAKGRDPSVRVIIERALARFAAQHGLRSRAAVTDIVIDAKPLEAGEARRLGAGFAKYSVSVAWWPEKTMEGQP